jgi:hypothetical protein
MQGTFLTFNIASIEEEENITNLATASIKNPGKSSSATIAPEKVISTENFDALISAEGQITSINHKDYQLLLLLHIQGP